MLLQITVLLCIKLLLMQAVELALKQVLLTDAQHRAAGGYSGGMKRRLSLAIALIGTPRVVMLDEPTTYVDQL
jgi:ABC-type multidrug transport system ATPase subunit